MMRVLGALVVTGLTVGGWVWLAVQGGAAAPKRADCRVGYVYDGDTVELICGAREYAARVVGLDTPETKEPRCVAEAEAGKRATLRLRALVAEGPVRLRRQGFDRYGRPLIRLWTGGRDVAQVLIGEGLAMRYRGGARPDWCARLEGQT